MFSKKTFTQLDKELHGIRFDVIVVQVKEGGKLVFDDQIAGQTWTTFKEKVRQSILRDRDITARNLEENIFGVVGNTTSSTPQVIVKGTLHASPTRVVDIIISLRKDRTYPRFHVKTK